MKKKFPKLFLNKETKDEKQNHIETVKLNKIYQINKKNFFLNFVKLNWITCFYYLIFKINTLRFISGGGGLETNFLENYRIKQVINFFKKEDIKIIYEFGSGNSTILFAALLEQQFFKKGIKGKIFSFEDQLGYLKILKKKIPLNLKKYIFLKKVNLKVFNFKNITFVKYLIKNYHKNIDLVYFDGPSPEYYYKLSKKVKKFSNINGNYLDMIKEKNFRIGFSDKRLNYFFPYKKNSGKSYDVSFSFKYKSVIINKTI